jgi:hypothetical protein
MKPCQPRHLRRFWATSGRSCSAALKDFFIPEADPAERVVECRQPGRDTDAALDLALELGERDVRRSLDQRPDLALEGLEQRAPVPAIAGRGGTAGRLDPLHQLDRRRGSYRKAPRGFAD